MKLKGAPRALPRRDPQNAHARANLPLAPAMAVFASGVLVAALMGCRPSPDAASSDQVPPNEVPTSSAPEPEKDEGPIHVKAPDAPVAVRTISASAPPVPTSVVIRPGHAPIRHAGAMVMMHHERNSL